MSGARRIVVVGASVAGLAAAEALREGGFDGELVLLSDERHVPYDRPPLSKQLLAGTLGAGDTTLRDPAHLAELRLDLCLDTRATGLDVARRRVRLARGPELAFDGLIVATGARARRLGLEPLPRGVHPLRTLDDALAVRQALELVDDVAIVGAGFIGAEVASTARAIGRRVTLVEAAPAPMAHVLGAEVGELLADLHRAHGVDLRCGVAPTGFEHAGEAVAGVRLDDGTTAPAQIVVVGVGAEPNVEWLADSGLRLDRGLVCGAHLAAAPGVYGAGDVVRWPHPRFGTLRVEHWTNAVDQGRTAAANLLAELNGAAQQRVAHDAIPYFWSDQHGVKLQLAGCAVGAERHELVRDGRALVALFGRGERLVATMTWDAPRRLALARRQIAAGTPFDAAVAEQAETTRPVAWEVGA